MNDKKRVKLYLTEKQSEKLTDIDIFEAKAWEDFVFVFLGEGYYDDIVLQELGETLKEKAPNKVHIFVHGNPDNIGVYGVEVADG